MTRFLEVGGPKLVLGMVHLKPLPGTPFHRHGTFDPLLEEAVGSARALHEGGADGCLVQTVDRVYHVDDESDDARTVAMGLIVRAIRQSTGPDFQVGVHMMRNAIVPSLAVAKVAGGSFVRASALVGRTSTEHGMVEARPLEVMAYRARIAAEDMKIIADVDSMHFKWFGETRSTGDVARRAHNVGADAVSLGDADEAKTLAMIADVRRQAPGVPVILAGYTNHDNAARLLREADGAFVGGCLEHGGWGGRIDVERVKSYVDIVRGIER